MQAIKSTMEIYFSDMKGNLEKTIEKRTISSQSVMEIINEAKGKLQDIIEEYHSFGMKTERRRTENLKTLLKECYDQLSKVSFVSAQDLDKMFEENILEANQLSLDNYQYFAEQIKQYELDVQSDVKLWNNELGELKEDLKDIYRRITEKSAAKFSTFFEVDLQSLTVKDIQEEIKKIKSYHSELLDSISSESFLPIEPEEVEVWLDDVQKTLAAIDQSASCIVECYKSIIIILFNRFFEELEELKNSLLSTGIIDKANVEDFQSELYTPGIEQLNLKVRADLKKMQEAWHKSIESMQENLNDSYAFLKAAAHIWDRHFQRIKNCQLLVLQDLANTVEKNSRSVDGYEAKMNLLIDKLRQSPDERKLESNYSEAVALLDNMARIYSSNQNAEIAVVQKYKTLMETEVDVLIYELKRFLIVHPADEDRDPKKQRKRASQTSDIEMDPNEALIPPQILYCIFHVDAAKNWMFGLWEGVDQYVRVCKTEIIANAEAWVEKQVKKVKERLVVKLAFHKPRYERLKNSIYIKRMNELNRHINRFESHKSAAEEELRHFKNSHAEDFKKCNGALEKLRNEGQKFYKLSQDSHSSHQVKSFLLKLKMFAKNGTAEIQEVCDVLKETYYDFLEKLKISNYLFLNCVRLFNENGNYCPEELDVLMRNIIKMNEHFGKQITDLVDKTELRMIIHKNQIEGILTENCRIMQEIIEEHSNNEKSFKTIISLRDSIVKEIAEVQTELRKIQNSCVTFVSEAIEKVGIFEYATKFAEEFHQISNNIQVYVRALQHPSPILCYSNMEYGSFSVGVKTSDRHLKNKRNDLARSGFLSYLESVTHETKNKNFMRDVLRLVHHTIVKLEKEGKEFYSKHQQLILDQLKIQQTYTEFIEDILCSCKNVLQQAEVFWTELAAESVATLRELQHFKERYMSTFINTLYKSKRDKITTVNEMILTEIVKLENRTKNDITEMYNKLRVLYGHPTNRKILQELEIEFDEFLNTNMEVKITETVNPLKDMLKNAVDQAASEVEKVTAIFNVQKEDNQLSCNIQLLEHQLHDKHKLMESALRNIPISSVSVQQTGRKSLDLRILRDKLFDPTDVEKFTSLSQSSVNTTSTCEDPKLFLKDILQLKEEYLNNIDNFAENKLLFHIKNFKDIWGNEIQSILGLYRVKYDKRDIF